MRTKESECSQNAPNPAFRVVPLHYIINNPTIANHLILANGLNRSCRVSCMMQVGCIFLYDAWKKCMQTQVQLRYDVANIIFTHQELPAEGKNQECPARILRCFSYFFETHRLFLVELLN